MANECMMKIMKLIIVIEGVSYELTLFTANPRKVRVEDNRGLKIEVKFDKLKGSSAEASEETPTTADKPREEKKKEEATKSSSASSAPNPNAPAFQPTPASQNSHWDQQQQMGAWTAEQGGSTLMRLYIALIESFKSRVAMYVMDVNELRWNE